jgi:cellulose synthase/poly-beta-1,6-N-acetylglucosamine synthase-like glycosyltransferase
LLLFIDADCIPDHDWVSVAREIAPNADLTGGRVSVFDETPPPRSGAEAFEAVFAFDFKAYVEKGGFSGAGNLVTRRDVFDAIGGFTNGVSEDREWTMRAVARGYSLAYEDRLRVSHPSRQNWSALRQKWRRMTNEMYQLNGTGFRARLRWIAKALAMPISAVVHVPKVLRSGRLNGPGEHLRAIGTLFRIRLLRMVWMLKQAVGLSI